MRRRPAGIWKDRVFSILLSRCSHFLTTSNNLYLSYFHLLINSTEESDDQLPSPHAPFTQDQPGSKSHPSNHHHTQSLASSLFGTDDETDDFDWDTSGSEDSDDEGGTSTKKNVIRAKRGRKIYLGCMKLARPVRLLLTALVGTAICMVPFIVVITAFKDSPAVYEVEVSSRGDDEAGDKQQENRGWTGALE